MLNMPLNPSIYTNQNTWALCHLDLDGLLFMIEVLFEADTGSLTMVLFLARLLTM